MADNSSDPPRRLVKQGSLSYIEQSLSMISTPQEAPVTIYPGPKSNIRNLSKADIEIADRLKKLRKRSSQDVPSEEEMAVRLAQLKGLPTDHFTKPSNVYRPPDNRTQVEKADDLINQMVSEVSLEAKCPDPVDDIEERLARLKGTGKMEKSTPPVGECLSHLSSLEQDDMDFDEIAKLAAQEQTEALKSVEALSQDAELQAVIAQACKELKMEKAKRKNLRDEELFSNSDDSDTEKTSEVTAKDNEEAERITKMYMEKAKNKKRKRKMKKALAQGGGEESSSSSLSSDSDVVTSDSEKLSDDSN